MVFVCPQLQSAFRARSVRDRVGDEPVGVEWFVEVSVDVEKVVLMDV